MASSKKSIAVIFMVAFAVCCYASLALSNDHIITGGAIDDIDHKSETDGYKDPTSLIRSRLLLEVHEKCPCWPACCWEKVGKQN